MKKQYLMMLSESRMGFAPKPQGDMAELIQARMRSDAAGHTHFYEQNLTEQRMFPKDIALLNAFGSLIIGFRKEKGKV